VKTIAGYEVRESIVLRTEPIPLSGALKLLERELRRPYRGLVVGNDPPAGGRA
jgi:hypothetical protein